MGATSVTVVPAPSDSMVSSAPMRCARSFMPESPQPLPLIRGCSTSKPQPPSATLTCSQPSRSSNVTVMVSDSEYLHAFRMASWQMRYACVSSARSKRSTESEPSKSIRAP